MHQGPRWAGMTTVFGCAACLATSLWGQLPLPGMPQDSPPPIFRVRSNLVLIDVIATRDGKWVPDLTANEVQVFEDGVSQRIAYFEAVDLTRPHTDEAGRPQPLPEAAQLVILLDLSRLSFASRHLTLKSIETVLTEEVDPRDMLMLATMGRSGLRIPVPMTNDHAAVLIAAREALASQMIDAPEERPDLTFNRLPTDGDVPGADGGDGPGALAFELAERERRYANLVRQTADTGDSLELLANYLQGRPGRKNVVFYTEGNVLLDMDTGGSSADTFFPYLRGALRAANRAQTSFYTIDPRGMRLNGLGFDQALHTVLSRETGGVAVLGTNDLNKGFQRAHDESRRYYRVAYVPAREPAAGKSHSIEVRVGREGVHLRHRKEYVEADAREDARNRVLNALAFPELTREFLFEMTPSVHDGHLSLHTRIPRDQMVFLPQGADMVAEVAFYALITDRTGDALVKDHLPLQKKYTLRFKPEELAKHKVLTADHDLSVQLKRGSYHLTFVVQQSWTERVSATAVNLEVR